jgi:hypothetical protein
VSSHRRLSTDTRGACAAKLRPRGRILCEAARTAKRSPEFAATYQAIARRRGKKIATTAIARNLLIRAYHLLAQYQKAPDPPNQAGRPPSVIALNLDRTANRPRASSRFCMSRPSRAR